MRVECEALEAAQKERDVLQKLYNKLKGSPPPGPIWRHRVHLLHHGSTPLNSPQTALSLRLFARGSLETTKARCPGGVQEHHVSRALVRRRARPQRLPAGALCGHIRSTRSFCHIHASYTRHATPSRSSGATQMAHASSICRRRHDLPRNTVSTLTVTSPAPSSTSPRSSMLATCSGRQVPLTY